MTDCIVELKQKRFKDEFEERFEEVWPDEEGLVDKSVRLVERVSYSE